MNPILIMIIIIIIIIIIIMLNAGVRFKKVPPKLNQINIKDLKHVVGWRSDARIHFTLNQNISCEK